MPTSPSRKDWNREDHRRVRTMNGTHTAEEKGLGTGEEQERVGRDDVIMDRCLSELSDVDRWTVYTTSVAGCFRRIAANDMRKAAHLSYSCLVCRGVTTGSTGLDTGQVHSTFAESCF